MHRAREQRVSVNDVTAASRRTTILLGSRLSLEIRLNGTHVLASGVVNISYKSFTEPLHEEKRALRASPDELARYLHVENNRRRFNDACSNLLFGKNTNIAGFRGVANEKINGKTHPPATRCIAVSRSNILPLRSSVSLRDHQLRKKV